MGASSDPNDAPGVQALDGGFDDALGNWLVGSILEAMKPAMKPLRFVGSSLDDLRNFPSEARRQAGFDLYSIQRGLAPRDWKPMSEVGPGAREIRIHVLGEWRVLYVAAINDSVYVLHAFEKRSRKTREADINLARTRLRQTQER